MHRGISAILMAVGLAATATAADAESLLERGAYLMHSIVACGNCHTPQGPEGPLPGMELAGGVPFGDFGPSVVSANITPDKETGVGGWSEEELGRAIREGIRPDGTLIGPPMPFEFYRGISDADLAAIIAYLRSVPAVKNSVPRSSYPFPLPASYGEPAKSVVAPPESDRLAYGAYLGTIGHCLHCHTPLRSDRPEMDHARLGAGGLTLTGPWGEVVSANITPDSETGIGGWSDAEIKRAVAEGVRPDGSQLAGPMPTPYFARMTDADLDALVLWLRTLTPVHNPLR
jgi:mono/diheme cytochrome c family protein